MSHLKLYQTFDISVFQKLVTSKMKEKMGYRGLLACFLLAFSVNVGNCQHSGLELLVGWSYADFTYPSEVARTVAREMNQYIPENIAILDSDVWIDERSRRIFVSTPRFREGIPATVSEVTTHRRGNATLLRPFPNWESQSVAECQGPVSVYRIHIDSCGRLWVLDTGRIDTFVNPTRPCQPKVLIYDLRNNDALIERHEFPDGVVTATSNLATLITDIRGSNCRETQAYIADTNANGLVVYDLATNTSWRVDHSYFHPFPTRGSITISGVKFELLDGVFGLALGPVINGDRLLYFHSFASLSESSVPTSVLRNYNSLSSDQVNNAFSLSKEARSSQSSLEVMTDDGILIFPLLAHNSLACWNSRTPYTPENIHTIYKDDNGLQFISGMKLHGDTLIVTSSRLQKYIIGDMSIGDVKYRILAGSVRGLLSRSLCYSLSHGTGTGIGGGTHPRPPHGRPGGGYVHGKHKDNSAGSLNMQHHTHSHHHHY